MTEMGELWMWVEAPPPVRKRTVVRVTEDGVTWSHYSNGLLHTAKLSSRQILSTQLTAGDTQDSEGNHVGVHYANVVNQDVAVTLRRAAVTFVGSRSQCEDLTKQIEALLNQKERHRPRSILVFINPVSGAGCGVADYRSIVKPILDLCSVKVHMIATEDMDHPRRVLGDYDLSTIQAVVTMGGDGALKAVVSAMMERAARDAGVDMDGPHARLVKPALPLGIIPAGTGNAVSMYANAAATDVETCVLNIVLGQKSGSDLICMRNQGTFVGYCVLMDGIGVIPDSMRIMEKLRWVGKRRYDLFYLPLVWWCWRMMDVEIEYKPVPLSHREFRLDAAAQMPRHSGEAEPSADNPEPGWQTFRGKASNILVGLWHFLDFHKYMILHKQPRYQAPTLSHGKLLLHIDKHPSRGSFAKKVRAWVEGGWRSIPADLVEQVEVTECRIKAATDGSFKLIHDGDVLSIAGNIDLHMAVWTDSLDMICIDDVMVSQARVYSA